LNGATGIIIAVGKGLLHSLYTPPSLNVDIIPVDFVVNCILAAGWKTGISPKGPKLSLGTPEGRMLYLYLKLLKITITLYFKYCFVFCWFMQHNFWTICRVYT